MLKNYFKIAFRNLWKHKVFSLINIMGLTVGMSACLLISLYVNFELTYDAFHAKSDRIYRVVTDVITPSETIHAGVTSWAYGPTIKQDFPEVEAYARINSGSFLVRKGDIKFQEQATVFADSSFFRVFDFKLIQGNPLTALKEPLSIVFTEKAAQKYFGDSDPVGQTVLLTGESIPAKVTGIMQDIPENSQIKGDMFVSMTTMTTRFNRGIDDEWGNFGATTYLLLKPGADRKALEKKFPAYLERRAGKLMREAKMSYKLFLEPLRDVHLHSERDVAEKGSMSNVYVFSVVAAFILLIACINFVNLTTARSAERAKEVGIRKVVGAAKGLLARQFVSESILLCLIAFVFSITLSAVLVPLFNNLAGKVIVSNIFADPSFLMYMLVAAIMIGILAGIYPALVLSSFEPVTVLKGRFTTSFKGILLRKGLVTVQFAISIALIIATMIVYIQMNYMRNRDLGFSKDQMLVVNTEGDSSREAFKESLRGLTGVKQTTLSSSVPGGPNRGAYSEIENKSGELQVANLDLYFVDFDYIPQFGLKMAAGRPFSREFGTDSTQAMVINEAAVKLFGYAKAEDAIGRRFKQWGREGKIVGVIKDFHFRSLQETIKPLTMRIEPDGTELVSVKIEGNRLKETVAAVEGKWKEMVPGRPFSYYFMDEFFDRQYRAEERFEKLFFNFAILAIFISCLGLLGLASYSTMQRTKEIGVRKVMGASVASIVGLLSRDFLKLVLIAFVVAAPVAYFGMDRWLENFAYRTGIYWWVFVIAAVSSTVIAFATVSFQSIRAALMNPVKSLRSE
ncbi:putative ABC transport system permease protein [Dyadobacter soli]|uniref:Putative ABC transport system permease protein n=1 Tax=Dyadobacter soli TaxID=659014 RepID=A0A1G7HMR4_9BACT|nr:ABC transporter permease [Dyadobacter soli]SDF01616.1 putative ABC transport system permease protein [Dyadobacter soli]